MKTLLASILLALLFASAYAQTGTAVVITEPVKYNDYIVDQQNLIGNKLLGLNQVMGNPEATKDDALAAIEQIKAAIEQALLNTGNLSPIEDMGLKKAAIDLFHFYQRTMQTKYPALINQVYSDTPDTDLINTLLGEVTAEEKGYDDAFLGAQSKFASANNFSLEENELQKDFDGN